MSPAKNLKVKDIAGKYGLSPKDVIRELNEQGFDDVKTASSAIPADAVDLVELYFEDYAAKRKAKSGKGRGKESAGTGAPAGLKTATIAPPVIVKSLAEALGKKPNEVVSGLMQMNVLASINQTVAPEVAVEYARKCGIELTVGSREPEKKAASAEESANPEDFEYQDKPGDLVPPLSDCDVHGACRPWQDLASGPHPQNEHRGRRGGRDHAAHRCVRRQCERKDHHLCGHSGTRGVYRHARPRSKRDRYCGSGRRGG